MNKDKVFKKQTKGLFVFDEKIANVFDDMLARSIPHYETLTLLTAQIIAQTLPKNAKVLDLGCSTANTLLAISRLRKDLRLYGLDNAKSMIKRAKKKAKSFDVEIKFFHQDIEQLPKGKFDVIIANYTLQFIRPQSRQECLNNIAKHIKKGGMFIMSEKTIAKNKFFANASIEIYHNYKLSQNYSHYEIMKKRQAIENVLIPYSDTENIKMLKQANLHDIEMIFKWNNFSSYIAFS